MEPKSLWLSKTLWLNAVSLVLAVLALPELISLLPVTALPYIALLNAAGNMVLRFVTNQAIK